MIPRTKVNYRIPGLFKSIWISESSQSHRRELEELLAQTLDCQNVLLTASGRGALYALLMCLPQRLVIIPAYTCKAVVEAASLAGKQIEFVESEAHGFNMNVSGLAGRLDSDTIVIATHQFGIPCNIEEIMVRARQAGAFVIEDVAASLGSKVHGRMTGTFGDAAFFSFDSTKLVNAPLKGGFLIAQDAGLAARCRSFASENTQNMALARKLKYLLMGCALVVLEKPALYRLFHNLKFNWRSRFTDDTAVLNRQLGPFYTNRLAEWQALLLVPQIRKLGQLIENRRRWYAAYHDCLQGCRSFMLPPCDTTLEWAPIRFPIRVIGDKLKFYRRAAHKGIDFAFSFTFLASPENFKNSHKIANEVLDLPFYDRLTNAEFEKVVEVIKEVDAGFFIGD